MSPSRDCHDTGSYAWAPNRSRTVAPWRLWLRAPKRQRGSHLLCFRSAQQTERRGATCASRGATPARKELAGFGALPAVRLHDHERDSFFITEYPL